MNLRWLRLITLLLVTIVVTACSSDSDRRYLDTTLGQPLEIPPDLSRFEAESNFDLPNGFAGDGTQSGDKVPVLAKIDSLQLQGSEDFYWLSVDESVDNLYQQVKNFWAFEGYTLLVDEPVIGVMQTEWIYKVEGGEQKTDSWWASLFTTEDLSASQDQFRTRIERDQSGGGNNRIYIVHRGTEYVYEVRIGDQDFGETAETDWQFRSSEPELEVEMLARLMVFLGLQKEVVDTQMAQISLFKPRASRLVDSDEKSPFLILKDSYDIAWNRVNHVLQRMNFEIVSSEFKSGFSGDGVFIVNAEIVETTEGSGFFEFGSEDQRRTRQFIMVLSEETHELTRMILEDEKGNFDISAEGNEFLSLLYEQLK
jgi:outer membrane protein assembly factor BamC